jgi:C-terminal processing protease CtpA/Prc
LGGVAEILPAKNHYTHKIVVLINELDFSAAEFLAAILQDNKRAMVFGERTAGAGGCVRRITFPNEFGIDCITVTWTMAWRTNGEPVENIGVHPDVRYSITAEDIRSGYAGYRQALLATISTYSDDHLR